MEIWLIEDGGKTGPHQDYEVRSRIAAGRCDAETPAWYAGIPEWTKLGEMEVFRSEFIAAEPPPFVVPMEATPVSAPWGLLFRRFFARWFDLGVYGAFWWAAMAMAGADLRGLLLTGWIMLIMVVPWFALEALMIHRSGRTPGKWLLGLQVVNDDGSHLTLAQAGRRSFRVMILGIGFSWGLLAIICQGLSLHAARRFGRPLWDQAGGHRVNADKISGVKVAMLVVVWGAAFLLQSWITFPYAAEILIRQHPQLRPYLEQHPFYRGVPASSPDETNGAR